MGRITRYVFGQLVMGMILVTAGLTCVVWLMQSLRFVEMIVNRGLSAGTFVYMTILMLPSFFPIVLPIALFTVVIFIYSKLVSDRELVVMRSAGFSQSALAGPAILLALITVLFTYILNLYVMPESWRKFREMQWNFRYSFAHIVLKEGAFNTLNRDITVFVRERGSEGQLDGVLVHDNRDPEKPTTYMAEKGALVSTEETPRLVLFDGNRQEMDRKTGRLSTLYFDRATPDLGEFIKPPARRHREARERTLDDLLNHLDEADISESDIGKFTVEAHKRLSSPLQSLGFTITGLACLLSGAFTRRSQTRRVVLSIMLLVFLQGTTLGLHYYCARNLELIPLLYVNAALPVVIGYLVLLRATDWRRRHRQPAIAAS
ncbi:MAG: LPS export ABC transporter permease LptF [Rhodospirillales bacterium]|jgi:lipopolysaccharide export system permease protein|nr:LPS export ABC transporter permease LptF [Rhodospirillales bacterium]